MSKLTSILLVEDNPTDVWALKLAIEESGIKADVSVLSDGSQAVSFIEDESSSIPDLLILDLNLPRYSGHEVLSRWQSSFLKRVPVLIVTSSDSPIDRSKAGAYTPHYFRKPMDIDEFLKVGSVIKAVLQSGQDSRTVVA